MDPDFPRPGPRDYIALLADILERLRPDIAMGRIVSSVPPRFTDATWGLLRQDDLMKGLVDCLSGRNSYQGRLHSPAPTWAIISRTLALTSSAGKGNNSSPLILPASPDYTHEDGR